MAAQGIVSLSDVIVVIVVVVIVVKKSNNFLKIDVDLIFFYKLRTNKEQ